MRHMKRVKAVHPDAQCMPMPLSTGVAIFIGDGRMISSGAVDAEHAWKSAARLLPPKAEADGKEAQW